MDMTMRRMRRATGRQLRLMQLDAHAVRFAIEYGAGLVSPAGVHGELVEAVSLGAQERSALPPGSLREAEAARLVLYGSIPWALLRPAFKKGAAAHGAGWGPGHG